MDFSTCFLFAEAAAAVIPVVDFIPLLYFLGEAVLAAADSVVAAAVAVLEVSEAAAVLTAVAPVAAGNYALSERRFNSPLDTHKLSDFLPPDLVSVSIDLSKTIL